MYVCAPPRSWRMPEDPELRTPTFALGVDGGRRPGATVADLCDFLNKDRQCSAGQGDQRAGWSASSRGLPYLMAFCRTFPQFTAYFAALSSNLPNFPTISRNLVQCIAFFHSNSSYF